MKKTLPSKPYTKNYPKRANKNQSSIVKKGYKRQQERLRDATVYTKTETVKRICDIWKTFLGRSGNRKLIKHDTVFDFHEANPALNLSLAAKVANPKFVIDGFG